MTTVLALIGVLQNLAGGEGGGVRQGVTKRCRLSWLTNSTLVYEPKRGRGRGVTGSQSTSAAVHMVANETLEI
jgi:hypothetical protein